MGVPTYKATSISLLRLTVELHVPRGTAQWLTCEFQPEGLRFKSEDRWVGV